MSPPLDEVLDPIAVQPPQKNGWHHHLAVSAFTRIRME